MTDTPHAARLAPLVEFLARIPAVDTTDSPSLGIGSGEEGGSWWVKFSIDIDSEIAWETVQELAQTQVFSIGKWVANAPVSISKSGVEVA